MKVKLHSFVFSTMLVFSSENAVSVPLNGFFCTLTELFYIYN